MKHYELEKDEVVLYKGNVSLLNKKGTTNLILTNYNFVLITTKKKIFANDEVCVDIYPINEIKYYNNIPQVIKKGCIIELYLLDEEVEFTFETKSEARKFLNATLTLLTNKTSFERGANKLKNTISMIDNSFGINCTQIAENAIKNSTLGTTTNLIDKGIKTIGKIIKK